MNPLSFLKKARADRQGTATLTSTSSELDAALAALRHLSPAEAKRLYRANRLTVWAAGTLMAAPLSIQSRSSSGHWRNKPA